MWQQYKRRFWTTQLFIAMLLSIAAFGLELPRQQLLMIFLAMQLGGVLGAWMGSNIKRTVERHDEELPLNRR